MNFEERRAYLKELGILTAANKKMQEVGVRGTVWKGSDVFLAHFLYEEKTHRYLKKKYGKIISGNLPPVEKKTKSIDPQKTIWVCWLQGIEHAPEVVQICFERLKMYMPDKTIILITEENLNEYIEIPSYIYQKRERGIISLTHFSDIVRIFLLCQYGGLWIDSTMYLTNRIPDFIFNSPLFVYKVYPSDYQRQVASSQFIFALSNNEILCRTKQGLLAFWKKENSLLHFSLFHLIFAIAVQANQHTMEEWNKIPFYNSVNNHMLQKELFCLYDQSRWEYLTSIAFTHKLTYKDLDKKGVEWNIRILITAILLTIKISRLLICHSTSTGYPVT